MSNLTSSASEQFLAIHSSLAILIFVIFYTSSLTLDVLYVVALVRAKDIRLKMKVLLINNLAPDLIVIVTVFVYLVLQPVRAYENNASFRKVSCLIYYSLQAANQDGSILAPLLFAVSVYVCVKCSIKKLKWSVILTYISVSWSVTIAHAASTFLRPQGVGSANGFCTLDVGPGGVSFVIGFCVVFGLCVCITVTFAVASFTYVKRNMIDSDTVKRSLAKVLVFEATKAVFLLIQVTVIFAGIVRSDVFISAFNNPSQGGTAALVIYYILGSSFALTALITPIMSVILLKPIHDAFKQLLEPLIRCLRTSNSLGGNAIEMQAPRTTSTAATQI